MSERRLIVVAPGHFHAALVQREMIPGLSPEVRVHAPDGPELDDYLARIAAGGAPWRLEVRRADNYLAYLANEAPGGIALFSGRNRGKIAGIEAAVAAGLHVLADKPIVIRRADVAALDRVLAAAAARGLVVRDMMTGRGEIAAALTRHLHADPAVFGTQLAGSPAEPGVAMASVHHLMKLVSGRPNRRPPWYFDVTEQGDALADIGTHLVDRVHATLFPATALDCARDIRIGRVTRWPTAVNARQFYEVTGTDAWPDFLAPWLKDGELQYPCNVRLVYAVRGVHVGLDLRWDWQEPPGGSDTHTAVYRGSRARLELRHGPAEHYRAQLYVVPQAEIGQALEHRIATLRRDYPGIGLERRDTEWRVDIPEALRIGHDAAFSAFVREFVAQCDDPGAVPAWERPNLIAKSFVCTAAEAAR